MCLTQHSTLSQLYCGGQFYWRWKPEYPEKTTQSISILKVYLMLSHVLSFPYLPSCQNKVVHCVLCLHIVTPICDTVPDEGSSRIASCELNMISRRSVQNGKNTASVVTFKSTYMYISAYLRCQCWWPTNMYQYDNYNLLEPVPLKTGWFLWARSIFRGSIV